MKGHWQSKEIRLLINDAHACLIDHVYSGKHQSMKTESTQTMKQTCMDTRFSLVLVFATPL